MTSIKVQNCFGFFVWFYAKAPSPRLRGLWVRSPCDLSKLVALALERVSLGSSPTGGARKKTVTKVTVFFQRCVPQAERDARFVRDVSFGCEVCLRHVIRNTSHHCERSEQHHYAKHNITLA